MADEAVFNIKIKIDDSDLIRFSKISIPTGQALPPVTPVATSAKAGTPQEAAFATARQAGAAAAFQTRAFQELGYLKGTQAQGAFVRNFQEEIKKQLAAQLPKGTDLGPFIKEFERSRRAESKVLKDVDFSTAHAGYLAAIEKELATQAQVEAETTQAAKKKARATKKSAEDSTKKAARPPITETEEPVPVVPRGKKKDPLKELNAAQKRLDAATQKGSGAKEKLAKATEDNIEATEAETVATQELTKEQKRQATIAKRAAERRAKGRARQQEVAAAAAAAPPQQPPPPRPPSAAAAPGPEPTPTPEEHLRLSRDTGIAALSKIQGSKERILNRIKANNDEFEKLARALEAAEQKFNATFKKIADIQSTGGFPTEDLLKTFRKEANTLRRLEKELAEEGERAGNRSLAREKQIQKLFAKYKQLPGGLAQRTESDKRILASGNLEDLVRLEGEIDRRIDIEGAAKDTDRVERFKKEAAQLERVAAEYGVSYTAPKEVVDIIGAEVDLKRVRNEVDRLKNQERATTAQETKRQADAQREVANALRARLQRRIDINTPLGQPGVTIPDPLTKPSRIPLFGGSIDVHKRVVVDEAYLASKSLEELRAIEPALVKHFRELRRATRAVTEEAKPLARERISDEERVLRSLQSKVRQKEILAGVEQPFVAQGTVGQQAAQLQAEDARLFAQLQAQRQRAIALETAKNAVVDEEVIAAKAHTDAIKRITADRSYEAQITGKYGREIVQSQAARLVAEKAYARELQKEAARQARSAGAGLLTQLQFRFGGAAGGGTSGQGGLTGFLGTGLMNTLRYGVTGGLLYGGLAAIRNMVNEAIALETAFTRIEAQFNNLGEMGNEAFNSDSVEDFKRDILDISAATGVLATKVAEMGAAFTGAFSQEADATPAAVTQATRIAAEFAQISGVAPEEIFNDLIASVRTFTPVGGDAVNTLSRLTDITIALRNATGVSTKELSDFIGRVAPIGNQIGASIEQISALGSALLLGSGVPGATLAEQIGRIFTGLRGAAGLEIARISRDVDELNVNLTALAQGDYTGLEDLMRGWDSLSESIQRQVIATIGSRREGATFATLLQNSSAYFRGLETATGAAGTRTEEFRRRQEDLKIAMERAAVAFQRLGIALFEAGLSEFLSEVVQLFGNFADLLTATVVPAVEALGDVLGGIPDSLRQIAVAGALALVGVRALGFLGDSGLATGRLASIAGGIGAGGLYANLARQGRGGANLLGGGLSTASIAFRQGDVGLFGTGLRTAASGITALAGGPAGLALIGGTIVTGIASSILSGAREEAQRQAFRDFSSVGTFLANNLAENAADSFETALENVDFRNLLAVATGRERRGGGRSTLETLRDVLFDFDPTDGLFGDGDVSDAQEAYQQEAARIISSTYGPAVSAFLNNLFLEGNQDLQRLILGAMNVALEDAVGNGVALFGESSFTVDGGPTQPIWDQNALSDAFLAQFREGGIGELTFTLPVDTQELATALNTHVGDVLEATAVNYEDILDLVIQLQSGQALSEEQVIILASIVSSIEDVAQRDPGNTNLDKLRQVLATAGIESALGVVVDNQAAQVTAAIKSLDVAQAQFDAGILGFDELIQARREEIALIASVIDWSNPDPENLRQWAEETKALNESLTNRVRNNYDFARELNAFTTGPSGPDIDAQISQLQQLIENPDFLDPSAQREAAFELLELEQQALINESELTDDLAERVRILNEGRDLSPQTRFAVLLAALNDQQGTAHIFLENFFGSGIQLTASMTRAMATMLANGVSVTRALQAVIQQRLAILYIQLPAALASMDGSVNGILAQIQGLHNKLNETKFVRKIPGLEVPTTVYAPEEYESAVDEAAGAAEEADDLISRIQDAYFELLQAAFGGDPVRAAQIEQERARILMTRAKDRAEELQAEAARIRADRQLEEALRDIFTAYGELALAAAEAAGDVVGAARISAEEARRELELARQDFAVGQGGEADVIRAEANVIRAEAAERDAQLQDALGDYQFLYDMGRITKQQFIAYLQSLKQIPDLTEEQIRDLDRQIRSLQQELGADLQFNLPSQLQLPTLYEVRRTNQAPGALGAYQDNRNVSITMYISNAVDADQAVEILNDALGTRRFGMAARRY